MLQKVVGVYRDFGLIAGSLYVLDRLLRSLSSGLGLYVYEFMVQPLTDKPLLPANLARGLAFREIERGDPEVAQMPARPDVKESRFHQGARCLGAYRNDSLVGYIWLCSNSYEEDEVRCKYWLTSPIDSTFDFDLVVLPEHRMGLGFLSVWHCASQYLRQRNVRYSFSRLTRFNLASRRSHHHLGWYRVGSAVFLKAWSWELMLATIAPFVSLTLGPRQRVSLKLGPEGLQNSNDSRNSRNEQRA